MDGFMRLRALFPKEGIGAAYLRDTVNIAYLTGFEGVFDTERAHALYVDDAQVVLHTDSRYAAACRAAAQGGVVQVDDEALVHAKWLAQRGALDSLGIEDSITLAEYRALQEALPQTSLVETDGLVARLRAVKTPGEIARLRAAQRITDDAFAYMVEFIKPGMTERQVQRELDAFMLSHGADDLAFPSIVATGEHGANPHAQPTDASLEAGQCVVMDFGAKLHGYCSDMTRMVFLGEPDARKKDAYAVLREANEQVQAMLRPGVTGAQAHQHALDVLEAGGFGGLMGHGLGHGVGREVHEQPNLSPRNTDELVAGNVVTVEPGIYIEKEFGMRLEDFGVVTEDGFDTFTRTTHESVII